MLSPSRARSFRTSSLTQSTCRCRGLGWRIASEPCVGLTPEQIIAKIVNDAAAYNNANLDYGFDGDPNHPIAGRYYGYLVRAALY